MLWTTQSRPVLSAGNHKRNLAGPDPGHNYYSIVFRHSDPPVASDNVEEEREVAPAALLQLAFRGVS